MIPLVAPKITDRDRRYIARRVDEGLLNGGRAEAESFERAFAARVGRAGGVAVNSGTSALHVALRALGVGPGDEVVIPTYTCVALLHAVACCGARAVLVDNSHDVARGQFGVPVETFRGALTDSTRAIIVSHMFGTIAPVPDGFGIPVIEDFTLSFGAVEADRHAGSLGIIGVCSLHESKMISSGRGGMIVADDEALLQRLRTLVDYDAELPTWRTRSASSLHGTFEPLSSLGMSELQAALGNSQLGQLDDFIRERQALARRYTARFRSVGIDCPDVPDDSSNVFYRYLVSASGKASQAVGRLRTAGIEAGRGVFPPIHVLAGGNDADFPGATWCTEQLVSVPVHPSLDESSVGTIERGIVRVLAS